MYDDYEKMARVEREIEKRMEAACEKDGWYVAVAMMPLESRLEAAEAKVSAVDAERGAVERKADELERQRGELRQIIKDTGSFVDARTMSQLERLGFRCVSGNKHWKLDYADVRRLGWACTCDAADRHKTVSSNGVLLVTTSTVHHCPTQCPCPIGICFGKCQPYGAFETLADTVCAKYAIM